MPRDVILFSGALFDSPLWTNRQHIATRLAGREWRVLYVEPRLFVLAPLFGRVPSRMGWFSWMWRHVVPAAPTPELRVIAQSNLLPKSREVVWISFLNQWWNAWRIKIWAWLLGFQNPVILLYDTEAAAYLNRFPASRVIYDCVDDHKVQAGVDRNPRRVSEEERHICERADAIAVTTEALLERFRPLHPHVHLVPNAADVQAFFDAPKREPADIRDIPHPRLGTVGALDAYKIDTDLLAKIATEHPAWHLVLVGPVEFSGHRIQGTGHKVDKLRQFPNIHFLGSKSHEKIPAYVHAFDVAIIPYRESDYNRSSFPLKFWEFMAAGKPVVTSGLPSLEPYRHLAYLSSSVGDFGRHVESALSESAEHQKPRREASRQHDWSSRVMAIETLLEVKNG